MKRLHKQFSKKTTVGLIGAIFIFAGVEFLFSFCSKVSCPAFSDEYFDKWFPYNKDQMTVFRSAGSSLTDTVKIQTATRTEATEEYPNYHAPGCDMSASFQSQSINGSYLRKFSVSYTKYQDSKLSDIVIRGSAFSGYDIDDTGLKFRGDYYKSMFYKKLTLNGRNFSEVEVIDYDTLRRAQGINRIWISKNVGLVAYQEHPSKELWLIQ